ncbi:hypothetical protein [Anaerovorax sp. IOR16]|uniref:hypothetical protein n=1 Tax=Anaerovorax sp. IOR16 TaxID=2773458 RepID=UPI0019D2D877|nr:hypothetical protein [Anaerovorax sp. IOR16]
MKNFKGRAKLRGKPLDEDCKKAIISTCEYGPTDNRKFCYGLCEPSTEEVLEKCKGCKAFVDNAEPPIR